VLDCWQQVGPPHWADSTQLPDELQTKMAPSGPGAPFWLPQEKALGVQACAEAATKPIARRMRAKYIFNVVGLVEKRSE